MKHTTLWETKTAFDAAKSSLAKPHVSYVREENYVYFIKKHSIPEGFVDLGLPSGTLWYEKNLGATNGSTPKDWYGNYYAWGEINQHDGWPEDKTSHPYDQNEYTYAKDDGKLTKYCNNSEYGSDGYMDNLTTLEPEDDAATVYNSTWKMPTKGQFKELLVNTASSLQDSYQGIEGLNGREFIKILDKPFKNIDLYVPLDGTGQPSQDLHLVTDDMWNYLAKYTKSELDAMISEVTSGVINDANNAIYKDQARTPATPGTDFSFSNHIIDTTSSASIFIPAAGYYSGSDLYEDGSLAFVWSLSLDLVRPDCAYSLDFNSDEIGIYGDGRCRGYSVRPVLQA